MKWYREPILIVASLLVLACMVMAVCVLISGTIEDNHCHAAGGVLTRDGCIKKEAIINE